MNTFIEPPKIFDRSWKNKCPYKNRFQDQVSPEMKRLFGLRKVLGSTATIPAPDAKIIFTKAPSIQYEQI